LKPAPVQLRALLDEGVPDSVADTLKKLGHVAILHRDVLLSGASDEVVCAAALANDAILIAIDSDMKQLAKKYGVTPKGPRFDKLHIIRLCCEEPLAAKRLEQAISLIIHEWNFTMEKSARRLWVDVAPHFLRSYR
jgi:predicted nuclease of predicted toxin-antitoxin system